MPHLRDNFSGCKRICGDPTEEYFDRPFIDTLSYFGYQLEQQGECLDYCQPGRDPIWPHSGKLARSLWNFGL
jgi:hypothetical protein